MSTQPSPLEWSAELKCPHGYRVLVGFDDLGYLMRPQDSACDVHLAREGKREERRLDTAMRRPSWFTLWRETRRARKALKKGPPWLSK